MDKREIVRKLKMIIFEIEEHQNRNPLEAGSMIGGNMMGEKIKKKLNALIEEMKAEYTISYLPEGGVVSSESWKTCEKFVTEALSEEHAVEKFNKANPEKMIFHVEKIVDKDLVTNQ